VTAAEVVKGRWYPVGAPALPGEDDEAWTNRMLGARGEDMRPYDHRRNRQCSIGWHEECSDREHSGQCGCPCHEELRNAEASVEGFNARVPVGTLLSFIEGCRPSEPPTTTTSEAFLDDFGWPMVELETFDRPVKLSWLVLP
jgi:hypothetical protein